MRFGDLIDRYTLNEATATGKTASGIELAPLGTFTLRTVVPWKTDDRRLGYLELGEEIDSIVRTLREVGKAELLISNPRNSWSERAGKRACECWDALPTGTSFRTGGSSKTPFPG